MTKYYKIAFTSKKFGGLELDNPTINEIDGRVFTDQDAACNALEAAYKSLMEQYHTQNTVHSWKYMSLFSGDSSLDCISAEVKEVKTIKFYQIHFDFCVWDGNDFHPAEDGLSFTDKMDAVECLRAIYNEMRKKCNPVVRQFGGEVFYLMGKSVATHYIKAVIETCEILPKGITYNAIKENLW